MFQEEHPKPEDLFDFPDEPLGLDVVLYLREHQPVTFRALQQEFYPVDSPDDPEAYFYVDDHIGNVLDALAEQGFLTTHEIGNEERYAEWQYTLSPEGQKIADTIDVMEDSEKITVSVRGSDGAMRSRLTYEN